MTQIISPIKGTHLVSYETWLAAIASSACIGFTSLVPWIFNLTFFEKHQELAHSNGGHPGNGRMKYLLSFAIGAILGDIFFHLIPESYQSRPTDSSESVKDGHRQVGLSIVAGIVMFIIVDAILEKWSNTEAFESVDVKLKQNSKATNALADDQQLASRNVVDTIPMFKSNTTNDLKTKTPSVSLKTGNNVCGGEIFMGIRDNNNNSNMQNLNGCSRTKVRTKPSDFNGNLVTEPTQNPRLRKAEALTRQNAIAFGPSSETEKVPKRREATLKSIVSKPVEQSTIGPAISVDSAGYLNLIANGFDNFTHGLAIGASFLIGLKVGFLTTFVIIIHEIPHEICDYAILVNSGFSRWEAVKAQSSVSLFGIIGTATALYVKSVETLNAKTVWILPFSAGSFLYIALVNLLPEILDKKTKIRDSLGQITCVIFGIVFMALVAIF